MINWQPSMIEHFQIIVNKTITQTTVLSPCGWCSKKVEHPEWQPSHNNKQTFVYIQHYSMMLLKTKDNKMLCFLSCAGRVVPELAGGDVLYRLAWHRYPVKLGENDTLAPAAIELQEIDFLFLSHISSVMEDYYRWWTKWSPFDTQSNQGNKKTK